MMNTIESTMTIMTIRRIESGMFRRNRLMIPA
jgi:hypothetical protein